jgi:hypothetical protein
VRGSRHGAPEGGGEEELLRAPPVRAPTEVARKRSQAPTGVSKAPSAVVKVPTGQLGITNQRCCSFVKTRMLHVPDGTAIHGRGWAESRAAYLSTDTHTRVRGSVDARAQELCECSQIVSSAAHMFSTAMRNVTLTLLCLPSRAPRLAPRSCKTDSRRSDNHCSQRGEMTAAQPFQSILRESYLVRQTM